MTEPRRHHYVPVSYLKRFTEPNSDFLYVLDLQKKEIRRQRPNKVLFAKDYYRQDEIPDGADPYVLEKYFANIIEYNAKSMIDKLINAPNTINEDDINNFIFYLDSQRTRVPRQIKLAKEIFKGEIENRIYSTPELSKEYSTGQYKIEIGDAAKFEYMETTMKSQAHIRYFMNMKWTVYEAPKGNTFITTDSPVSFYNPKVIPPNEAGIAFLGTSVLFPLSSTHLLELEHPHLDEIPKSKCLEAIKFPKLEDVMIEIETRPSLKDKGGPSINVSPVNWIMSILAHRYLIADNETSLLKIRKDLFGY